MFLTYTNKPTILLEYDKLLAAPVITWTQDDVTGKLAPKHARPHYYFSYFFGGAAVLVFVLLRIRLEISLVLGMVLLRLRF